MKEKILYTCDVCHTDYVKKLDALECERNHKLLKTATITGDYKSIGLVHTGIPSSINVKFKGNDEWFTYKR